ncbi:MULTISPECIES: aspartate carbamoyltransferase [unclassified Streptomyces]|uniref:aspartate carbamoyltransferase n=1 Tax=unclassified Streptomyces TaxID=2593676 RepID=UPI00225483FE|nr:MULTISPECIES: aspartate carbamoyltransferase [unclassified Streptomyces]MCX5328694.1 aspartate carbamoyltransferase [Streptomyces sp. NBC_00140]MCX5358107.1 aspartate carbamoyltransferase [Streptomyces sp. NBC_00124]
MNIGKRRLLTAGITTAIVGAALGAALLIGTPQQESDSGQTGRQEAVAERGRTVMPFDLEETTHHFTPTETGGVQDVVADQPDDARQVDLIRTHLQQEAKAFGRGDFGDPAQIHGDSMPGLRELQEGYERVEVRYREQPDGATLTYATDEPALVDALHDWFEAQLSDHGGHAETGH